MESMSVPGQLPGAGPQAPPDILVRGGTVVTGDPALGVLAGADVLVTGGRIASVGPSARPPAGAAVIDAAGAIVLPGLIDTHRHTWQSLIRGIAADWTLAQYMQGMREVFGPLYRPQDVFAATLAGAYEALDAGITTLVDFTHIMNTPEHADAALDALAETGIRAVFCHGTPMDARSQDWYVASALPHGEDIRRLAERGVPAGNGLVTLAMAARGPQHCDIAVTGHDWRLARSLGLRLTLHAGSGRWGLTQPVRQLHAAGLLGPDLTFVHCTSLPDEELAMIADSGGAVSITPEVELHMGHGYPATGRLLAAGIRPGLGVDVVTGVGGDLFGCMRVALAAERGRAHAAALQAGGQLDRFELTTTDVLDFATLAGARAFGMESVTGSLTPGKDADLILLRPGPNLLPLNNPVAAAVLAATPANVDTVLVRGRVLKSGGALAGVDYPRLRRLADQARDRLFGEAGVRPGEPWYPDVTAAWRP
jgi:5-methylthioadenosine/S-adenosylhomocysteine deaminase